MIGVILDLFFSFIDERNMKHIKDIRVCGITKPVGAIGLVRVRTLKHVWAGHAMLRAMVTKTIWHVP